METEKSLDDLQEELDETLKIVVVLENLKADCRNGDNKRTLRYFSNTFRNQYKNINKKIKEKQRRQDTIDRVSWMRNFK